MTESDKINSDDFLWLNHAYRQVDLLTHIDYCKIECGMYNEMTDEEIIFGNREVPWQICEYDYRFSMSRKGLNSILMEFLSYNELELFTDYGERGLLHDFIDRRVDEFVDIIEYYVHNDMCEGMEMEVSYMVHLRTISFRLLGNSKHTKDFAWILKGIRRHLRSIENGANRQVRYQLLRAKV